MNGGLLIAAFYKLVVFPLIACSLFDSAFLSARDCAAKKQV